MRYRTGQTFKANGSHEVARRQRQISSGRLKAENGLIPTPRIVIPEVTQNLVVETPVKAKRVRKPKVAVAA